MKFIIATVFVFVFSISFFPSIYGHGLGSETLPPVIIDNRNVTVSISVLPETFSLEEEQSINVRFFEADTGAIIEHVTYGIKLSKGDEQIFEDLFYDELGNLFIKIRSGNTEKITAFGNQEPTLGGWMKQDSNNPLVLEGPVFTSGGLYDFHVEIVAMDFPGNALDERITFNGAISIADKNFHEITTEDGSIQLSTTSYYDQIYDFHLDSNNKEAHFSMPFDWTEGNIERIYILHQELHVPKIFSDLLATKYEVLINGVRAPEESVYIDDYSSDDRTVHLIMQAEQLQAIREDSIKESSERIDFVFRPSTDQDSSLNAASSSLWYKVTLSWDPSTLQSETNSRFYVDIEENYVPDKEIYPANYNFVLIKDDTEIFREQSIAQVHAEPKSNFIDYVFSPSDEGAIKVIIENINNQIQDSAEFVIVVIPNEKDLDSFPIFLESQNYEVQLSWMSNPLEIEEESQFFISIYEKDSEVPLTESEYDLVLIQGNEEIFRTTKHIQSSEGSESFVFAKENLGEITLRIENIDGTNEFVEIPITVTPEFPLGIFLIFPIIFSIFILLRKSPIFSRY